MRIAEVCIERFGVWRNLKLPLSDSGFTVLYGPNEAGKTTLLRFIRGVLFGFHTSNQPAWSHRVKDEDQIGSLVIELEGQCCELRRRSQQGSRGVLTVTGLDDDPEARDQLMDFLHGTDDALIENVFAIGLHELQELATLEGEEIAQHIYGLTLGPEGESLLNACETFHDKKKQLLDASTLTGRLAELIQREEALSRSVVDLELLVKQHAEQCAERNRLSEQIEDFRHRQAGLQSQLRGNLFLERIWSPWKLVRECEHELKNIPPAPDFPPDGVERLNRVEQELAHQQGLRDEALANVKRLRRKARQHSASAEMLEHASTIQVLVDQRQWLQDLESRVQEGRVHAHNARKELDRSLIALGTEWSLDRLVNVNTSTQAHALLVQKGDAFRSAVARRAKLRRRYQRAVEICRQKSVAHKDLIRTLNVDSIPDAITAANRRLSDLQDICEWKFERRDLRRRITGIREQLAVLEARIALPKWVYGVMGTIGGCGVIFAVAGLVTGIATNAIVGAAYGLLGATCAGMSWAFTTHHARHPREQIAQLRDQLRQCETRLQEIQELVRLAINEPEVSTSFDDHETETGETGSGELQELRAAARRLVELERCSSMEERIHRMRRRLSQFREQLNNVQHEASVARQSWCESLSQLGFFETLRLDEAFAAWYRISEANERRRALQAAENELRGLEQMYDSCRARIEELGRRTNRLDLDYQQPSRVLAVWERELEQLARERHGRRRLLREAAVRRRESAQHQSRINELSTERSAMFMQAGVSSRAEFERRAADAARRRELEQMLNEVRLELETAAQTEPDLAVVEEDLIAFDPSHNAECIRTVDNELQDLRDDLERALQQHARVNQQIEVMEADRRSASLRHDLQQIKTQRKQAAEEWIATVTAERIIAGIRAEFERNCQPTTLGLASRYLERLTCQKYRNVWTPLGRRHLYVDDDHGRSIPVELLSGGAREQLFLAVRLAMIDGLVANGTCLPMVLDDIFVNFDQRRSEAAADVLIDFASKHRQVLFLTCHLHLAHLFESKGVDPIWLPAHHWPFEERRAG